MNKPSKKYTLNQIGEMVAGINVRIDRIETRIDRIEKDVKDLKQDVKTINARLDYNNLKPLPNNK